MWLAWALAVVYAYLLGIAATNRLLMRKPGQSPTIEPRFSVLIPARNEEANLRRLLPRLIEQGVSVYVFDDESEDETARVARELGAKVIQPREPLPEGWTGKNRACHELAKVAAEDSPFEWFLFLDADTLPLPSFTSHLNWLIENLGGRAKMISGFPTMLPGAGIEPLYLSWVPWVLLAMSPFGLVSRSGIGHAKFTNGQFGLWHSPTYFEVNPNERLRDKVLEDVLIGRLMAKEGRRVEIVDLSQTLQVEMYETYREALDGMSKNTYQITGSTVGTVWLAFCFLAVGWGWLFTPLPWLYFLIGMLVASKFITDSIVRGPWWLFPFIPITCTLAAYTCLRSLMWHKKGVTTWKG
ncbi:MAG: glycosyltransferase family 2 protein [Fimbriimonadaceae bacterium]|nr:glycosyltransferase family 2 protein [Fimbriimonadaceae bacterium]